MFGNSQGHIQTCNYESKRYGYKAKEVLKVPRKLNEHLKKACHKVYVLPRLSLQELIWEEDPYEIVFQHKLVTVLILGCSIAVL